MYIMQKDAAYTLKTWHHKSKQMTSLPPHLGLPVS